MPPRPIQTLRPRLYKHLQKNPQKMSNAMIRFVSTTCPAALIFLCIALLLCNRLTKSFECKEHSPMMKIVLAEDHSTVREGIKLLVNAQDDTEVVGEAGDGAAAIKTVREKR